MMCRCEENYICGVCTAVMTLGISMLLLLISVLYLVT